MSLDIKSTEFLDIIKRLAEALIATSGLDCEIVVHDFCDLEHSVVLVVGNITGRNKGAPVPDLEFVRDELDEHTPDQINYKTTVANHTLQSSTIWIRNKEGAKPSGAICINVDYSNVFQVQALLDKLLTPVYTSSDMFVMNTFARDLDELIEYSISDFCREKGIKNIDTMYRSDRHKLILFMEEKGLFKIRGAVNRVADLLNISRASIYNYRSQVNAQEDSTQISRILIQEEKR